MQAFFLVIFPETAARCFAQGRTQKWPKEGVLRSEIVKGGRFEGAEASFC